MSSVPPLLAIDVSSLNNSFNVISFISSNPSIKHFHHFYTSPGNTWAEPWSIQPRILRLHQRLCCCRSCRGCPAVVQWHWLRTYICCWDNELCHAVDLINLLLHAPEVCSIGSVVYCLLGKCCILFSLVLTSPAIEVCVHLQTLLVHHGLSLKDSLLHLKSSNSGILACIIPCYKFVIRATHWSIVVGSIIAAVVEQSS